MSKKWSWFRVSSIVFFTVNHVNLRGLLDEQAFVDFGKSFDFSQVFKHRIDTRGAEDPFLSDEILVGRPYVHGDESAIRFGGLYASLAGRNKTDGVLSGVKGADYLIVQLQIAETE